jgi:hypothetical protein
MRSRTVGSSRSLMESDPSAYFEQLLQSLVDLEEWIGKRDEVETRRDEPAASSADSTTQNDRG